MEKLISFLQINLFLIAFYAFYWLLLRKETFHMVNRFFLLLAGIISIVLPLISFKNLFKKPLPTKELEYYATPYFSEIEVLAVQNVVPNYSYLDFLVFVYILGVSMAFFIFLIKVNKSLQFAHLYKNTNGIAFSFFGKIFVDINQENSKIIYSHEKTHAKQLHFIDLLFFELLKIVFWFNPAIYFYSRSIKLIHEFLADFSASLEIKNRETYAEILFRENFNSSSNHVLTHYFFNDSSLKKRIWMLFKIPSNRWSFFKFVFLTPLFGAMIIISSFTFAKKQNLEVFLKNIETPIVLEKTNSIPSKQDLIDSTFYHPENNISENFFNEKVETLKSVAYKIEEVKKPILKIDTLPENRNVVFNKADVLPEFPGGITAMYTYLQKNIKYPEEAHNEKIEGRVYVKFIIDKDGSVHSILVLKGIGYGCDEEAERVIKSMPKWSPGLIEGKPVALFYNMPVVFTYKKKKKKLFSASQKEEPASKISSEEDFDEPKLYFSNQKLDKPQDFSNPILKGGDEKNLGAPPYLFNTLVQNNFRLNTTQNSPIYYLDGKEVLSISNIDPKKIQSISVLNGQKAIKTYGERAKKGVIFIETKKN